MPATAGETFYDLALRALAEQESQVASLRTRAGTLVAGAAVVATLLAKPVFSGSHPDGSWQWLATGIGIGGLATMLAASVFLLRSHDLVFALDLGVTHGQAEMAGLLDEDADVEALQIELSLTMADQHAANNPTVLRMRDALAVALFGLIAEVGGLGLATAIT